MSQKKRTFAASIPPWLMRWALSIGTLNPEDDLAKEFGESPVLRQKLDRLLLSDDVCNGLDALDRQAAPRQQPEQRRRICGVLLDATKLSVVVDSGIYLSASERKKKMRYLAKRCGVLGRDLSIAAPFLPASRLDYLDLCLQSLRTNPKAPLPSAGLRYSYPSAGLGDAMKVYAALLDQAAGQPQRQRRQAGIHAKRNALVDHLVRISRIEFQQVSGSLLAAIATALGSSRVSESVVRARAALRK